MSESVIPPSETVSSSENQNDLSQIEENQVTKVTEFDWLSYLDEHDLEASPEAGFMHVENSLDSGVREGILTNIS